MVSFHRSTVCYQVASLLHFFLYFHLILISNALHDVDFAMSQNAMQREVLLFLSTTRFSLKRYVGRLSGASKKGWFAHLRLFTTEFVKTSCDLSRRDNTPWDTGEFHIFATFFAHHFFLIGTKNF
uniref:Putative conserved secreted protein n=1 Tax=Ixodes scapularis TaxID=6945 RepID=A0A4D5RP64_IXOSC